LPTKTVRTQGEPTYSLLKETPNYLLILVKIPKTNQSAVEAWKLILTVNGG